MEFLERLSKETGLAPGRIIELSGALIELVLASYDDFNVTTIDSLMSAMVKAVSPDLDLPADYEIAVDAGDEMTSRGRAMLAAPGRQRLGATGAFPGGTQEHETPRSPGKPMTRSSPGSRPCSGGRCSKKARPYARRRGTAEATCGRRWLRAGGISWNSCGRCFRCCRRKNPAAKNEDTPAAPI